jgi:hypothetical protein
MDTPQSSANPSDYLGLKTELQNIAGVIEQYPDHLKQRAFELITSYLGNAHTKDSVTPQAQEAQAVESAPAASGTEVPVPDDGFSTPSVDPDAFSPVLEHDLPLVTESSTNMLRRRIRLRTMSPMRWQSSS